jgi:hypothetical protein
MAEENQTLRTLLPYFGYGTLLGARHMRERYPSAEPLGISIYDRHKLGFARYATAASGGCTIVSDPGGRLWGVLYRMSDGDVAKLLAVGGDAQWYEAREIDVRMAEDGRLMRAVTLRVNGDRGPWVPPAAYGRLITDGAHEANLPAEYCAQLATIVAKAQDGI